MADGAIRRVSATEFKAHCLALMDEVERTGETIVITKRGREVARLVPAATSASWVGSMRGQPLFADDVDLTAPTITGRGWLEPDPLLAPEDDAAGDAS